MSTEQHDTLIELFGVPLPLIGMVHSRPLPGSPLYEPGSLESVYEYGVEEALRLAEGGVDGLLVENAGDHPYAKPDDIGPETPSCIAVLTRQIRSATDLPIGVNIVANAAEASLAAAVASGACFVRVNQWVNAYVANEGLIEGAAPRALRYRRMLGETSVKVFADVHVKHGSHAIVADRPLEEQARDAAFFDADVLIATGHRTGDSTQLEELLAIRDATNLPVIVGSGLTVDNVDETLPYCDGAIVGSALKEGANWLDPVDVAKVEELSKKVKHARSWMGGPFGLDKQGGVI